MMLRVHDTAAIVRERLKALAIVATRSSKKPSNSSIA